MIDASRIKETLDGLKKTAEAKLKDGMLPAGLPGVSETLPKRLGDIKKLKGLPATLLSGENGLAGLLKLALCAFMGLLAFLNLFIRPEHPHFGVDAWFGFWPLFGLLVGLAMVFVMKRIVQPLIVRKEDYYDDL